MCSTDPDTAVWRSVSVSATGKPRRSDLAHAYRHALDQDWRDYYEGPYLDDGPSEHEDAE